MIEWKKAKTGQKIPFIDNKAMASMVNPIKEAQAWALRVEKDLYEDSDCIVVLGLGAAFHIEELAKVTHKNIHCIDFFQDLVLAKSNTNQIKYYYIDSPLKYWQTPSLCSEIKGTMQIFIHGPSIQSRKSSYFELRNEICLRTKQALANYKYNHGEINSLTASKLKVIESNNLLDLAETSKSMQFNLNNKNNIMWKILGDLIK